MSKFFTPIPVGLGEVILTIKSVPGIHLAGVKFNEEKSQIEIFWETDVLKSGLDHAIEFPKDALEKQELPAHVKIDRNRMRLLQGLAPLPEAKRSLEPSTKLAPTSIDAVSDAPAKPAKPVQYDKEVEMWLDSAPPESGKAMDGVDKVDDVDAKAPAEMPQAVEADPNVNVRTDGPKPVAGRRRGR